MCFIAASSFLVDWAAKAHVSTTCVHVFIARSYSASRYASWAVFLQFLWNNGVNHISSSFAIGTPTVSARNSNRALPINCDRTIRTESWYRVTSSNDIDKKCCFIQYWVHSISITSTMSRPIRWDTDEDRCCCNDNSCFLEDKNASSCWRSNIRLVRVNGEVLNCNRSVESCDDESSWSLLLLKECTTKRCNVARIVLSFLSSSFIVLHYLMMILVSLLTLMWWKWNLWIVCST